MSQTPSPAILLVLRALSAGDGDALTAAVRECRAIDERLSDGASTLFHAVLTGRIEFVETILAAGADPNFRACAPAEDRLAPTALDLAQQARFLLDWDRYQPIASLLESHGALDGESRQDVPEELQRIKARAKSLQTRNAS